MFGNSLSDLDLTEIQANLIRAIGLNMDLYYRLGRRQLTDEENILLKQTKCCYETLAYIQNALEIERYESGNISPCYFNISDKVEDIAYMIRSKTRNYRAKINFISEIEKKIVCFADPDRFAACLVNLVVNAFQNVDQDNGEIRIILKKLGDYAAVTVVDNGYGMTQQQLEDRIAEADGGGFGVMKRFCLSVGTRHIIATNEYSGLGITVKVPLKSEAPDGDRAELCASDGPERHGGIDTFSAAALLIYKLKDAVVTLR